MKRTRNANGSGLVLGVAGFWLVFTGFIMSMMYLANVGLAIYYKQKLEYCSHQLAVLAANEIASPYFADADAVHQDILDKKMNQLLQANDLGNGQLTDWNVTYDGTAANNPDTVSFKISVVGLRMMSNVLPLGLRFPAAINLADSQTVRIDNTRPKYCTESLSECSQAGGGVGVDVWLPTFAGGTYANGFFNNQQGTYPRRRFTLANYFGTGTVKLQSGGVWNTNFADTKDAMTYPGVKTALTKLFQVEGNN